MEMHAKQGCGDGFVAIESLLHNFLNNGLGFSAGRGIEP